MSQSAIEYVEINYAVPLRAWNKYLARTWLLKGNEIRAQAIIINSSKPAQSFFVGSDGKTTLFQKSKLLVVCLRRL
jgi:hypothetical protein